MKPLDPATYRVIPGRVFGTPKELWGFVTARSSRRPVAIAHEFMAAHAALLGIDGLERGFEKPRVRRGLSATHVIIPQLYRRLRIHRAFVTVHIDARGRIYLVKNRAVPRDRLYADSSFRISDKRATSVAWSHISSRARNKVWARAEKVWFWARTKLHAAWKVRVHRKRPRTEWILFIDAERGTLLQRWDNLAFARAARRARIFDPNPVIAAPGWNPLDEDGRTRRPPDEAYRTVRLRGLKSARVLDGHRVSTRATRHRIRSAGSLVDTVSTRRGFDEAMAYYHVDQAVRRLEAIGYRGPLRIFKEPIEVNAHGTRDDNSWYSPGDRRLTFGTGDVDDAEDAEVILHELGHAVQDAICPDFGQSLEAAAMGEGFGDYFAASFFAAAKRGHMRDYVMSWDGVTCGDYPVPCQRPMIGDWTYDDFDHDHDDAEHENGMIWSAALWEVWHAVGREVADRIIVESHFQLDGFTTFARGARAILDADRNRYGGRHLKRLIPIFHRRGIGPVV